MCIRDRHQMAIARYRLHHGIRETSESARDLALPLIIEAPAGHGPVRPQADRMEPPCRQAHHGIPRNVEIHRNVTGDGDSPTSNGAVAEDDGRVGITPNRDLDGVLRGPHIGWHTTLTTVVAAPANDGAVGQHGYVMTIAGADSNHGIPGIADLTRDIALSVVIPAPT